MKLAGRYELRSRIAAGGMGTVYEARDDRLGRTVAVKMLRDELADDPRFVERFRREARAVAALSHPNIAGVFDYGEDEHHYIVMEFVEGHDLSLEMRGGPLPPPRAAHLAAQTCDALAHAHAAGVIHRDVKPANIIVGDGDHVKVTDFGIARAVGDATLTATGSVLGTAHYLSPEQASGAKVGPASDVYSVGVVLFEMLTASVPFEGDSPVAIAMRHISEALPPPSSLDPSVPPAYDAIVTRATAKDPAQRWPSAAAMGQALTAAAAESPRGAVGGRVGPGGTAVLTNTDRGSEERSPRRLTDAPPRPVARAPLDPARIGRMVLLALGALVALTLVLVVARVASEDGGSPQRAERAGGADAPAAGGAGSTGGSPAAVTIPDDIVGRPAEDVASELGEAGLEPGSEPRSSGDYDVGLVISSNPPPGSSVEEGDPVTLIVSAGDSDEDRPGRGRGEPAKPPKGPKPPKEDRKDEGSEDD